MTGISEANSAENAEIRGLAQLRRATELAHGYEPVQVTRAEASAILDRIAVLSEVAEAAQEFFAWESRQDWIPDADLGAYANACSRLEQALTKLSAVLVGGVVDGG